MPLGPIEQRFAPKADPWLRAGTERDVRERLVAEVDPLVAELSLRGRVLQDNRRAFVPWWDRQAPVLETNFENSRVTRGTARRSSTPEHHAKPMNSSLTDFVRAICLHDYAKDSTYLQFKAGICWQAAKLLPPLHGLTDVSFMVRMHRGDRDSSRELHNQIDNMRAILVERICADHLIGGVIPDLFFVLYRHCPESF